QRGATCAGLGEACPLLLLASGAAVGSVRGNAPGRPRGRLTWVRRNGTIQTLLGGGMVDSTHDGNAAEFTILIAAIAEAWPRLEAMFARGDEWREFAASLLYLLREAEEEGS